MYRHGKVSIRTVGYRPIIRKDLFLNLPGEGELMNSSAVKRENISWESDHLHDSVRCFLAGDRSAFEAIRLHLEPIVHSVVNASRHRIFLDQVEDIRQECWIEVIQKLSLWDPLRGSLRSFMYRCVSNCVASYFRRCKYFSHFIPSEDAHEQLTTMPEESLQAADLDICLRIRFNTPVSRYVIHRVAIAVYLRVFERCRNGFIKDVARIAVIPPKRAEFLINYAVVTLRRHGLEQKITEEGWSQNFLSWA